MSNVALGNERASRTGWPSSLPPPTARVWLAVLAGWIGFGVINGTQFYANWTANEGPPLSYWVVVRWHVGIWTVWAALTPLVVAIARREPPRLTPRSVGIHVGAALVIAVAAVLCAELMTSSLGPFRAQERPFLRRLSGRLGTSLHLELIVYLGIVAATHAFDNLRQVRERDRVASALAAQLAEAQLAALRLQLQPHFLFNTLHAIGALVREQETTAALETLERLSALLRYALETTSHQKVALSQELEMVGLYAAIQHTRFAEHLSIDFDADPAARQALVPSLILQPLVENAIRHGIARRTTGGHVVVRTRAFASDQRLLIEVLDNGPGFPDQHPPTGVGLANTRERLELLYGGAQRMTLGNRPEGGARVSLDLPLEFEGRS